jgi:hypothetical protein
VTDWGQSLSLVYELRREITRLRQANARLQTDRTVARGIGPRRRLPGARGQTAPSALDRASVRRDLRHARAVEPVDEPVSSSEGSVAGSSHW